MLTRSTAERGEMAARPSLLVQGFKLGSLRDPVEMFLSALPPGVVSTRDVMDFLQDVALRFEVAVEDAYFRGNSDMPFNPDDLNKTLADLDKARAALDDAQDAIDTACERLGS